MELATFSHGHSAMSALVHSHVAANPQPGRILARASADRGTICKVNLMPDDLSKTAQTLDSAYAGDVVKITWEGHNIRILVKEGCNGKKISGKIPNDHYILISPFFSKYPRTFIRDDGALYKHCQ